MSKSIFGTVLQWWLTFGKRGTPKDEQSEHPTNAIAQPPQSSAISIVPLQAGGTYNGPMERYTEITQLIEAKKKDVIEAKMRKENPPRIDRFTIARRRNDRE